MIIKPEIKAYCLDWHTGSSNAFIDLLVEPLKDQFDIRLTSWDGKKIEPVNSSELLIFCMLPPTDEILQKHKKAIWIPMWDQAQGYNQQWWNRLPKHLNIISFSDAVNAKAKSAGLTILDLRYAVDPNSVKYVSWDKGIVISYWNRVGLVGPDFLNKLCRLTRAKKLIFRSAIDPRIEKCMYYDLPDHLGDCEVVTIKPKSKEEYLEQTKESNVLVAPRKAEGVGLIFLEAMARGCAVIAYDAPTMNEYITNGVNGYLFGEYDVPAWVKLTDKLGIANSYLYKYSYVPKSIDATGLRTVGEMALKTNSDLYLQWQSTIPKLAKFISEST